MNPLPQEQEEAAAAAEAAAEAPAEAGSPAQLPPGARSWIARGPFNTSCAAPVLKVRAPDLGEHTDAIMAKPIEARWAQRDSSADFKKPQEGAILGPVLQGITVVELSEHGSSAVSSAAAQLSDYGANVIKLEPSGRDPWRTLHPKFFNHLNRGKTMHEIGFNYAEKKIADYRDESDLSIVKELVFEVNTQVFLTDYPGEPWLLLFVFVM